MSIYIRNCRGFSFYSGSPPRPQRAPDPRRRRFDDDRFQNKASIDKRGKKVKGRTSEDLRRYYRLKEDEQGEDKAAASASSSDEDEASTHDGDAEAAPGANMSAAEIEAARRWAKLRGLGSDTESSSDEDDAGAEAEDEDDASSGAGEAMQEAEFEEMLGGRETWGAGWDAIHPVAEQIPESDETRRIAVVDLDWSRIRAVDLFAVLSSFLPTGGKLERLTVYLSDYGKERIEAENREGPTVRGVAS